MWPGPHAQANLQVLVDKRVVSIGGSLDSELPNGRPVEQQLDLVRLRVLQPVDVPGITAREPDLDVVLSVLHERIRNRNPSARADRKSRNVLLLRDIGRDSNDVALERGLRAADRQPADSLRS